MSNIKTENDFCEKFNTLLKEYKEEITSFPELEKQYCKELAFFSEKIIEQNEFDNKTANEKFAAAITEAGIRRAKERAKSKDGKYGIYTSGVRERVKEWLRTVFCEDELSMLGQILIEGQEPDGHYKDMLFVMLHNTPHIALYPCASLIKTDEEEINS